MLDDDVGRGHRLCDVERSHLGLRHDSGDAVREVDDAGSPVVDDYGQPIVAETTVATVPGLLQPRAGGREVQIVSQAGGMDIEEVAADSPEALVRLHVDPLEGFRPWQARRLVYGAGVTDGSGLAGITLARELRKLNREVPLQIVAADEADFYSKPSLSNALPGGKSAAQLVVTPRDKLAAELGDVAISGLEFDDPDTNVMRTPVVRSIIAHSLGTL